MDFVIYDLETTGLSPEREEIIQIAAMKFRDGKLLRSEAFSSYARPSQPISGFISRYTGITNAHVAKAPRPHEALLAFSRFVGDAGLIAHNGHRFDSKFLRATCLRHRLPNREVLSIDSIQLSKRIFGTVRGTGHSLDRVLSRLNISGAGHARHDARGDVELLGRALEAMWRRLDLDAHCSGIPTHPTAVPLASDL
jgi:DNA polymerase III subunit epsilon